MEKNRTTLEDLQSLYVEDRNVNYILNVRHTDGSNARTFLYGKTCSGGWSLLSEQNAIIGKNGIGKRIEGDGKTPSGELHVTGAFGINPNPGTALSYTDIGEETVACDEDCGLYNRIVNLTEVGFDLGGERMIRFIPEYNYGLMTDYNAGCIYPQGSNIFVHCKGEKPFTAGCIAFEEDFMRSLLLKASSGLVIFVE